MKILPPIALFGVNALSFLRGNKEDSKNLFHGLTFLRSFKSLVGGMGQKESITEEEELQEVTRLLAQNIGEKELIHAATKLVPSDAVAEVSKVSFAIGNPQKHASANITQIFELPKLLLDLF